jgi:hypothetical protein
MTRMLRFTDSIAIEYAKHLRCFNEYLNIIMRLFPCHDSIASSKLHGYNALTVVYRAPNNGEPPKPKSLPVPFIMTRLSLSIEVLIDPPP